MVPQLESPLRIKLAKQAHVIDNSVNFNTMKKMNRRHTTFGKDLFVRPKTALRERFDPSFNMKTRDQILETTQQSIETQKVDAFVPAEEQIVMKNNKFKILDRYLDKDEILINQEKLLNIFLDKDNVN
jgi:hypothetical protein